MNEAEKKAIEMIEYIQDCNTLIGYSVKDRTILAKALLNLIKKQSKEIEKLKIVNQMQKYRIEVMDERELISRDEVEEIIKTEIKKCENEKENANRIHYNYWNRFEQQLQSILDKIKGDDK